MDGVSAPYTIASSRTMAPSRTTGSTKNKNKNT